MHGVVISHFCHERVRQVVPLITPELEVFEKSLSLHLWQDASLAARVVVNMPILVALRLGITHTA